jgi:hypothetical protein
LPEPSGALDTTLVALLVTVGAQGRYNPEEEEDRKENW